MIQAEQTSKPTDGFYSVSTYQRLKIENKISRH
jgi:hypothetical protein